LASRREAEKWIQEGRVTVNGTVVRKLGSRADPLKDKIKVDGKLIRQPRHLYYLFHKPTRMITSMRDPQGRPSVGQWLDWSGKSGRLFPVGRLDFNSSGLLILTNDGEMAQRLMHPRYGIKKSYRAKLSGCPSEEELNRLRRGIRLEDGITAPARVRVVEALKTNAWVEIEIGEGRYREVRRMFEALGYFVEKLIRIRMGPVRLGTLAPGAIRPLSPREVAALKRAAGM
jgi:pseudouridine synthase